MDNVIEELEKYYAKKITGRYTDGNDHFFPDYEYFKISEKIKNFLYVENEISLERLNELRKNGFTYFIDKFDDEENMSILSIYKYFKVLVIKL